LSKECKKCGYIRKSNETGSEYECPKCGAVYAKVEAALARKKSGANKDKLYSPPASALEIPKEEILASRWARLEGQIVDTIAILITTGPVLYFTGLWKKSISGYLSTSEAILIVLFGLVVYLAINGYLLSKHGQTIGKLFSGTRIVSVETNEIIPFRRVFFVRYFPLVVVANIHFAGAFVVILDALFVFRKDKRCIHDLITGTKVIKVNAL